MWKETNSSFSPSSLSFSFFLKRERERERKRKKKTRERKNEERETQNDWQVSDLSFETFNHQLVTTGWRKKKEEEREKEKERRKRKREETECMNASSPNAHSFTCHESFFSIFFHFNFSWISLLSLFISFLLSLFDEIDPLTVSSFFNDSHFRLMEFFQVWKREREREEKKKKKEKERKEEKREREVKKSRKHETGLGINCKGLEIRRRKKEEEEEKERRRNVQSFECKETLLMIPNEGMGTDPIEEKESIDLPSLLLSLSFSFFHFFFPSKDDGWEKDEGERMMRMSQCIKVVGRKEERNYFINLWDKNFQKEEEERERNIREKDL